jgi:hypothetical protein
MPSLARRANKTRRSTWIVIFPFSFRIELHFAIPRSRNCKIVHFTSGAFFLTRQVTPDRVSGRYSEFYLQDASLYQSMTCETVLEKTMI